MNRAKPDGSGPRRRGMASLELVIATAITLPAVAFLFRVGLVACRNLAQVIGTLVGWPYL